MTEVLQRFLRKEGFIMVDGEAGIGEHLKDLVRYLRWDVMLGNKMMIWSK